VCGNFTSTESLRTNFTKFTKIYIFTIKNGWRWRWHYYRCYVLSVKLHNAGDRHDVTEKTAFYSRKLLRITVRSYLRRHHQESVYYSLLPDLQKTSPWKIPQFFCAWNLRRNNDVISMRLHDWLTGGLLLVCPLVVSFAKFHTSDTALLRGSYRHARPSGHVEMVWKSPTSS